MTHLQLEALTLRIVDQVRDGQPVEDGQVELKRVLPADPYKAARRIGGHANASRGQPIVWIIGLDEDEGVKGADKAELSDWWPQVQRYFDDLAPELLLQPMNVPVEGDGGERLTVVALTFDTSRLPFVVAAKGQAGPIQREVPYRDATGLRSAKRADLIRMSSPATPRVEVDLLSARFYLAEGNGSTPDAAKGPPDWRGTMKLYVNATGEGQTVFPAHLCSAEVVSAGSSPFPLSVRFVNRKKQMNTVVSGGDLIVTGPGEVQLSLKSPMPATWGVNNHLTFRVTLQSLQGDAPLVVTGELSLANLSALELQGHPWTKVRGWDA